MTLIVTSEFDLNRVVAPRLPNAPELYEKRYHDQFADILRLYFNRLDNILGQLGTLSVPYGAFSSDQDQTAVANTATLMTLNTTDFANGVSIATSKITVTTAGIYNLQFSIQFKNIGNTQEDPTIWLKINGIDLANSATQYTIPARKSAGIFGYGVASLTFMLDLNANDYVEIYWVPTSTDITIEHLPASVSPAYPAIPSVIACMLQVA